MTKKFKNKYRIESTRLQNWDYGWNGSYFVTLVTKDRINHFGQIEDGKMILSNIGVIADILWYEIKNHAQNIELDEFVVIPNHIHGIIGIKNFKNKIDTRKIGDKKEIERDIGSDNIVTDNACVVSLASLANTPNSFLNNLIIDNQKSKKRSGKNDFKTKGEIPSHPSLDHINQLSRNTPGDWDLNFLGNRIITNI